MKKKMMSRLSALALTVIIAVTATGCSNAVTSGEQTNSGEASQAIEFPNAKVSISDGKFNVDGKELWINGANTPWQNWNDFSGNMDEEFWDKTFEELVSDGINCTRIWINCNGENVVRLKSTGAIKGINGSDRKGHTTCRHCRTRNAHCGHSEKINTENKHRIKHYVYDRT